MLRELFKRHQKRSEAVVVSAFGDGRCNSKCLWCINQYQLKKKLLLWRMDFEDFRHFLELNDSDKFPLIPYGQGEPTIHREFVQFCEYALNEGWVINGVHTNLADPILSRYVFDVMARFKYVTVNFGGGTWQTQYANMQTNLTQVFENLEWLVKVAPNLKINAKMVLNRHNIDEVDLLRKKLYLISPRIELKTYPLYFSVSDGCQEDKQLFFRRNLVNSDGKIDERVPCREKLWLDEQGNIQSESKLKTCYGLNPTVRPNFDVTVCCRSRWYGGVVGNALKTPMKEIIGSEAYREAEDRALKRDYVEYCKFCS